MTAVETERRTTRQGKRSRAIGAWGTSARVLGGGLAVGSVADGHFIEGPFKWPPWIVGLVAFPAVVAMLQSWWARRHPGSQLSMTGPLGYLATTVPFPIFYLTPWYAPSLSFTSDAVVLFVGGSALLAGLRGYSGCEILAVPNWLLRRSDKVGCVVFSPVDSLDEQYANR